MNINLENILFVICCAIFVGVAIWFVDLLSSMGIKGSFKIGTKYAKIYPMSEQGKLEIVKVYKDKSLRRQINKYYAARIISWIILFMVYPLLAINYSSLGSYSGGWSEAMAEICVFTSWIIFSAFSFILCTVVTAWIYNKSSGFNKEVMLNYYSIYSLEELLRDGTSAKGIYILFFVLLAGWVSTAGLSLLLLR